MRPEEREQPSVIVDADALQALFGALRDRGCTVVGPTVRDGAIVIDELPSAAPLPYGALL
jgi:sulfhydrogenase subunit beta (sulfur reductase)